MVQVIRYFAAVFKMLIWLAHELDAVILFDIAINHARNVVLLYVASIMLGPMLQRLYIGNGLWEKGPFIHNGLTALPTIKWNLIYNIAKSLYTWFVLLHILLQFGMSWFLPYIEIILLVAMKSYTASMHWNQPWSHWVCPMIGRFLSTSI